MENNIKPRIKSFIYLDEDKMYSISSQLFEGMTQYILQENVESYNEEHQQKGNFLVDLWQICFFREILNLK